MHCLALPSAMHAYVHDWQRMGSVNVSDLKCLSQNDERLSDWSGRGTGTGAPFRDKQRSPGPVVSKRRKGALPLIPFVTSLRA